MPCPLKSVLAVIKSGEWVRDVKDAHGSTRWQVSLELGGDKPATEVTNQPHWVLAVCLLVGFLARVQCWVGDAASPVPPLGPLRVGCSQHSMSLTWGSFHSRCPKQQQT